MRKEVVINGNNIEYWIEGSGPILFFLHGSFGSYRFYLPLLKVLAKNFTVYAPTLPGMGKSASPKDNPSFEMYAKILDVFISKFSHKQQYTLVGHSIGAAVIVYLDGLNRINPKKIFLLNVPVKKIENYVYRTIVGWTSLVIIHLSNFKKLKINEIIPWDAVNIVFRRPLDFIKIILTLKNSGQAALKVNLKTDKAKYNIFTSLDDKYVLPENSYLLHKELKGSNFFEVEKGGHVWFMYYPEILLKQVN